jgi:hypothetical protein
MKYVFITKKIYPNNEKTLIIKKRYLPNQEKIQKTKIRRKIFAEFRHNKPVRKAFGSIPPRSTKKAPNYEYLFVFTCLGQNRIKSLYFVRCGLHLIPS